ncbi:DUF1738 domain-containing protein, partial [Dysosmobacter welbionis]
RVAPADGPQHVLFKGLGVHRDPGDPVGAEHHQLFRRDGVRPARLHSDLLTGGTVEGGLESSEDPVHLLRRQGGGGAAAHVEGPHPQSRPANHLAAGGDLPTQGVHIRGHQGKAPLHRLADKGAIGAPGWAEGNAHVHVNVPLLQPPGGLGRGGAGLQGQGGPGGGDEIVLLQIRPGLFRGLPVLQGPGHRLVGPDAGEHSPGGRHAGDRPGRQEEAGADGVAAEALPLEIAAGEGLLIGLLGGLAAPAEGDRHPAEVPRLLQRDHGPAVIAWGDRLVDRQFPGEQIHQALL